MEYSPHLHAAIRQGFGKDYETCTDQVDVNKVQEGVKN